MAAWALVALTVVGLAVGCGGGQDTDAAVARANSTNLQRLANLYFAFQSEHEWRGPKDEAEYKSYIRAFDATMLARINVDPAAIDALFVSERDGQPFKIRYGVPGSAMSSSAPVIFESAGVDGKFQVGLLNMTQREVDQAEYDQLWAGKAPAADAARKY
jgi:hypothetical protein